MKLPNKNLIIIKVKIEQQQLMKFPTKFNRAATTNEIPNKVQLTIPYSGKQDINIQILPKNIQIIVIYQSLHVSYSLMIFNL